MTEGELRIAAEKIAEASVKCERETGCPAELSAAQAALESGWLQSAPGNNCFGIKDTDRYPGAQYKFTKELLNGEWKILKLTFEVYPTLADCFIDHARLVTSETNCYAEAWRRYRLDHDLDAYIDGVAKHYATDDGYAEKVKEAAHGRRIAEAIAAERVKPFSS
jgi:flagellum-specific peptidoglycan hydrolase FlgJ